MYCPKALLTISNGDADEGVGWSPCDSLSSLADPGTTSEPYQNPGDRVPGFVTANLIQ